MFHLLRETAREFDVILYAFTEGEVADADLAPVLEFVSRVVLVPKPRYREPRWSSLAPPEVCEYHSPEMLRLWRGAEAALKQVEYTYLASYSGDILVEHDVTFDLYAQIFARKKAARERTLSARWDWWRWQRYERRAIERFPAVVAMSEKDAHQLAVAHVRVIENGVDLTRFTPSPERPGRRLLFIGSFRHFPNIVAFRFLIEEIFPLVPDAELTVVAGPDALLHWRNHTGTLAPPTHPNIEIHQFVADVRPLYHETNIVVVPTRESAGTNVKVLEALAMERVVVGTPSGCAGLGLVHGETAWIAETAEELAAGIRHLLDDLALRLHISRAGRQYVERHFDWRAIGARQRALYRQLLGDPIQVRAATPEDLPAIAAIQASSPEASQWEARDYLTHDCRLALLDGRAAGFLAVRETAPGEREILNLAVDPAERRRGVARRLLGDALTDAFASPAAWFLEVRESNTAALQLYKSLGFNVAGRRENYYHNPSEGAIVMRFLS
jgi:ribosomal-protein-alanine acetyltransferase